MKLSEVIGSSWGITIKNVLKVSKKYEDLCIFGSPVILSLWLMTIHDLPDQGRGGGGVSADKDLVQSEMCKGVLCFRKYYKNIQRNE